MPVVHQPKRLRTFKYHIIGGHKTLEAMMNREGAKASGLGHADFIFFMGGADINPRIYGDEPHPRTQTPNSERDRIETSIFKTTPNQFRVGICRGAQLLHALNGGKLWQHVEGHHKSHDIRYTSEHGVTRNYFVSSTHHQMMRLQDRVRCDVWAVGNETEKRELPDTCSFSMAKDHWADPEIIRYKDTQTLCFQPHPEYINPRDTLELFVRCLLRTVET